MTFINCVLVVGGGSIGQRHLEVVRECLPNVKLILCSRSGQQSTSADIICTTLEEAIQYQPQIAIVASVTKRHIPDSLYLAKQGIHLLIEKPLSYNLDGIDELNTIIQEKNLTVTVGYNLRYLDILQKMKQLIDSKPDIGRIMRIDCECSSFLPDWRPGTDYRHGNSVQKEGGGVILELSHELDYLQWFFGDLTLKSSSIFTRDNDLEVEDSCFSVLEAEVLGDKVPIRLTLDFFRQDAIRELTLIGMNGTLKCDLIKGAIDAYGHFLTIFDRKISEKLANNWREVYRANSNNRNESYIKQLMAFISRVEVGKPKNNSIDEGIRTLALGLAIKIAVEASA